MTYLNATYERQPMRRPYVPYEKPMKSKHHTFCQKTEASRYSPIAYFFLWFCVFSRKYFFFFLSVFVAVGYDEFMDEVDRLLLREYGRRSPLELETLTGIPAHEVGQRLERILGERDFLGEDARIGVLLHRLDLMVAEIEGRLSDLSDRNIGAVVNAAAGAIGRQLKVLADLRDRSKVDIERVQRVYADELVRIVELSFERLLGRLEERFPEVESDDLRSEFEGLILLVARDVDDGVV